MPTYGHFIPNGHFPIRYSLYGHFIPYGHFPLWTLFHMDILPYGQFADSPPPPFFSIPNYKLFLISRTLPLWYILFLSKPSFFGLLRLGMNGQSGWPPNQSNLIRQPAATQMDEIIFVVAWVVLSWNFMNKLGFNSHDLI